MQGKKTAAAPGKGKSSGSGTKGGKGDSRRHAKAYHDFVLDEMKKIDEIAKGDQKKFLNLYEGMKEKIKNNYEMMYNKYWKEQKGEHNEVL